MYMYTHRINVELENLCLVPEYLVHRGMHDMQSLMKMYAQISCTIPLLCNSLIMAQSKPKHIRESTM
jgi:hypothetical protein